MHSLQNGIERWYLARLETHRADASVASFDAAYAQLRARREQLAERARTSERDPRAARPRASARRAEKRVADSE